MGLVSAVRRKIEKRYGSCDFEYEHLDPLPAA